MKILVTGGAGYIGSVLVPLLLHKAEKLVVIDNFLYNQTSLLDSCFYSHLDVVRGDARDHDLMQKYLHEFNPDFIIPLACFTGMPICEKWPQEAREVIVDSIKILLDLRLENQAIIYPTTNSGYGVGEDGIYCTEDTPLRPVSLYGKLKVEAEKMILESGNSTTLRLATAFGTSPRMRLDLLVNDFVFKAAKDGRIKIFEPHFKRNYIHVRDIAYAFIHCVDRWERMKNGIYNVGLSSANLSKWELCEMIQKYVPNLTLSVCEGRDPDQRNYIVSNEKIEKTGFVPKFSLDMGIRELLKAFEIVSGPKHEVLFSNNFETSA